MLAPTVSRRAGRARGATAASSTSRVLPAPSMRTRTPSGIVAMCLPWPTGTFAIAGIPSGAISSSSISSIDSVDSGPSGTVW